MPLSTELSRARILKPGSRQVSNLPFYTPSFLSPRSSLFHLFFLLLWNFVLIKLNKLAKSDTRASREMPRLPRLAHKAPACYQCRLQQTRFLPDLIPINFLSCNFRATCFQNSRSRENSFPWILSVRLLKCFILYTCKLRSTSSSYERTSLLWRIQ